MNNRMYEICGNCGRRYGLHINQHCYAYFNSVFKSTGKYEGENMGDKIQMTEKQARFKSVKDFCDFCFIVFGIMPKPEEIEAAQLSGYIIKSELQQKVEEAEEKYKEWFKKEQLSNEFDCYLITNLYDTVQLLKQSHPEFKK